ncbi:MAG: alcohol dehydrogenase catalytic domain-containing protein [Eubacteriales bacterium]|nr:alcohol dehydrogenase catalytic domain-containing protein [Eubacteriales bacterium]
MRSVLLNKPGELIMREIEKPIPAPGEVLIKVKRMGICGSDIHAYHGQHPTIYLPVVQGHEFSGTVEALGEGVTGFEIGDFVTARPQYTCGECYHCKSGHENICHDLKVIGCNGTVPGAAQDYIPMRSHLVFKLEDSLSYEDGAMVEPVAVAVAAVGTFTYDIKGKNILVLGAGTIGNLVAQVAKAKGAKAVMITDVCDEKLQIAKNCGIDYTVNTMTTDLAEAAEAAFGKDGIDGALECVGVEATVNQAIKVCRKRDDIIIVGIFAKDPAIRMIDVQEKEFKMIGTLMYLHNDFQEAIDLITERKINLEPLKTAHFKLEEFNAAYQYISDHRTTSMKVFIDVDD